MVIRSPFSNAATSLRAFFRTQPKELQFELDNQNIIQDDDFGMFTPKTIILILGLFWIGSTNVYSELTTNSNNSQFFKFKFDPNKPLVYDLDFKSRTVNDLTVGSRNSLTKNTFETHYKIRMTATGTNQDGTTTVLVEPFDFTEDVEIVNASGHLTTSVRGVDVLSKNNDLIIVDTKNGIGKGQAQNLKFPIYPYLISGYFYVDTAGNIKSLNGDLPFIDFWQNKLKGTVGFFSIVFPTNSISIRDSWTNTVIIKDSGGTTYNGDGLIQPNVFVRELDSVASNVSVACFSLYESEDYKNLGATIEQPGQQMAIVFPERHTSMNGTFHFDQKLGRLIDMKKTVKMQDSANCMFQGNPARGNDDIEEDTSIQLITP